MNREEQEFLIRRRIIDDFLYRPSNNYFKTTYNQATNYWVENNPHNTRYFSPVFKTNIYDYSVTR
jgi:hypothetical protein